MQPPDAVLRFGAFAVLLLEDEDVAARTANTATMPTTTATTSGTRLRPANAPPTLPDAAMLSRSAGEIGQTGQPTPAAAGRGSPYGDPSTTDASTTASSTGSGARPRPLVSSRAPRISSSGVAAHIT